MLGPDRSVFGAQVLAQDITEEAQSFLEDTVDFLRDETFLGTVGILVGAVLLWYIIKAYGHRAVLSMGRKKLAAEDEVTASERLQRMETLWVVIRRVILIGLVVLTGLTLLGWWGLPIAPFVAVGGIVGLAVGFGSQSLVKDIITGFFIISENQFAIGDVVTLAGVSGKVEDIRLRITVLRDLNGHAYYVPNGEIAVTTNRTQDYANVVVDVGVGYGEDVDRVTDVLRDELDRYAADEEWSKLILAEPQILGVQELADWSVNIRVLIRVKPESRWPARREFLRRLKNRLDAEGIEIPFPYMTLVPGDPEAWTSVLGHPGKEAPLESSG